MKEIKLSQILKCSDYNNGECFRVFSTEEAEDLLKRSPISDGFMMSTTTFFSKPKFREVKNLRYF
jgi:hypothetical protein